ncbi:MAG: DNRLRE domain-containing protein, partial [Acidobacteria bacterium]|nr:DNRLRE domain-containing protein [Acidobacteriota bacterium]
MNLLIAARCTALLVLAVSLPAAGSTITLAASQDAWIVDADVYRDSNFGYTDFVWADWSAPTNALISFDLASISKGSKITSASLRLYHSANAQFGQNLYAYRNLADWSEDTVTASNAPGFEATPVSTLLILDGDVNVYREWDISSVVQGWVNGTFLNAGLRLGKDATGGATPYLSSREATVGMPELVITYEAGSSSDPQ